MDDPRQRRTDRFGIGLAGVLIVVQLGFDVVAGFCAVLISAISVHEVAAQVLLLGLVVAYVGLLLASTRLAGRDQRDGRRSPANWAMVGLLGSAGVSFVFFAVLSILGFDASGVAVRVIPGGRGASGVEILGR